MKTIVRSALLLAVAFVAVMASSVVVRPQQPVRLQSGQTYIYEYTSRVMTGIPDLQDQYSGLEIRSQIVFQGLSDSVAAMKMTGIRVGKHNGHVGNDFPSGDVVVNHEMHAQFQQHLQKPIRFVYSDGKVKAFEADQSEPEWSLNMKKAVLSLLNLDLQPKKIIRAQSGKQQLQNLIARQSSQNDQLSVFPVYEEGIGGLCETKYELYNSPMDDNTDDAFVLNVTKTRNYDNCLTEPVIANDNYDVRGCPWVCRKEKSFAAVNGYYPTPDAVQDPYMSGCPCGKEPHESPVDAFAFSKYNVSLVGGAPLIEGVYQEGRVQYDNNGDTVVIITQQNLTLNSAGQSAHVQIAPIARPQRHNELSFRIPKPTENGHKMALDIPYYHLFGQPEAQELIELVPEILDSLASDIASEEIARNSQQIGQKSVQLVNAMAVLNQHQLEQLFEEVAKEGASLRATQKEQVIRKLFLDALPLAGSNDAALAIKQLILENKVTTSEAKELVEAVPQNLFLADSETIDAYLELFTSPKIQSRRHLAASTGIAFGKMIKEACVKRAQTPGDIPDGQMPHSKRNAQAQQVVASSLPSSGADRVQVTQRTAFSQRMKRSLAWESQFTQDVCGEEDVNKYVQIVARLLQSANTFHQKVTLIETLAHMAVPQVLPVLEPYISGSAQQSGQCPGYPVEKSSSISEECDFIRQVAIYSLAHVTEQYPKQVAPLVLPVYEDKSEAYEVRIAAFTTLVFAQPQKQTLQRIAAELNYENNKQIKSFVYSALNTLSNVSAPCFQHASQHAQQAVKHAPDADYGYQYSRMSGQGFFDEEKDFGLFSLQEWISSNISRVPRAGYFSIGQSSGPFQDELVQLGFQAKGLDSIVERVLEPNGLISEMFEGMRAKSKDRRVNKRNAESAQQALEALKNKLNLRTRSDDEPKATFFFKLLDRTSYYALDKHYIHQMIDSAEDSLKDIASGLLQGQQYHYVKLVMPSQLYKVIPSELGLPVVVTHRHPLILSLKVDQAKLQMEVQPKTVYPTGANLTAQITPSIFYSSQTFAFALNPADRMAYGTHVQKTTHAQLPIEVSIGYSRPKNLLTWSVIPKMEQNQEIVFHKTQSHTFIAKASISGAPDSDWLQNAQEIKSQAVPFKSSNTWLKDSLGLGVRVEMTSEDIWSQEPITSGQTYDEYGLVAALVQSWRNPGLKAREVHVQLEADSEEPISGYDFTLKYKWVEDSERRNDADDSDESSASDESDSDQSDESSASDSSESKSSESDSSESGSKSSESSNSSEESNESKNSKNVSLKKKIQRRMNQGIREKRSSEKKNRKQETNESSDESSNESGSQSFSKSGSKASSQSSSSESSSSSEESNDKSKNSKNKSGKSESAQSSESDSSSSSDSDESKSMEDAVFNYDDVMQLILGQDFKKRSIKKITNELVKNTKDVWTNNWDDDNDDSSSDDSNEEESSLIPQTISHDIVFTARARGPRPTYYAMNVLYVHTYDHRIVWLKSDAHIKAPKGVYMTTPTLFCADAVIAYPTLPNEFYYEPQMAAQQARVQAKVGWGAECHSQGGVLVTGVLEQTEDHVITEDQFALQEGQSGAQVQNWYVQQCAIDRSEGRSQSYACQRAIIASSYFNQMIFDIKYKGIPKQIKNYTMKANLALKVKLYDHVDVNYLDDNNDDAIRVTAQYSQRVPDIPLLNVEIKSPQETATYQQVHVPYWRPLSALLPTQRVYENLWSNYDMRSQCHLMEDYVRTFDNVTFQMPESPCQYLLAKDCSAKERFAVFAQQLETEAKTKIVTILTSGQEIKLLPPQQMNVAQVVVDGHAHELTFRNPVTLIGDKNNLRIYLRATPSDVNNPIIVVESDGNDLEILYDGKNAKITVGAQYGGRTCGLCGDNNDEEEEEFSGPDMCQYEEAEDFANSYALSGQHCEQIPRAKAGKRCPREEDSSEEEDNSGSSMEVVKKTVKIARGPNGQSTLVRQEVTNGQSEQQRAQQIQSQANIEELETKQQEMAERQMQRQNGLPVSGIQRQTLIGGNQQTQKLIQRLRTQYMDRDEMTCFSTRPLLSCVEGVSRPLQYRSDSVDFHCLPKSSPFTQQLILEAQKQVIRQLANKRVDLKQVLQIPTQCIQI